MQQHPLRYKQGPQPSIKGKYLIKVQKEDNPASPLALTGVLQTGSNALHGQDEGILQPRRVLTRRVQRHELSSRLARVHHFLGQMGAQRNMVIWVTDPLQCVCLADIHGGDVCVTEAEPLLQVGITFKKILVPSNLTSRKSSFLVNILTTCLENQCWHCC